MNIGDIVEIRVFDDGNQELKDKGNIWKITKFKFNKGKSIIKHMENENIKERSISSWKLRKIETQYNIWNPQTPE
tara:strand:+ start:149 stop:373 length:225 start_codon:yes stop_codon:yes gene_type:complete